MMRNIKFIMAVALLAVLGVVFGVVGTVAPPLPDAQSVEPSQSTSSYSDAVGHFLNPPTYDSGWIDISNMRGQSITLTHDLNTTEAIFDVVGKSFPGGAEHKKFYGTTYSITGWNQTYGGSGSECVYSMVQTVDGGYALAGYTYSYGAGTPTYSNVWLVKTDASGNALWNATYGGANYDSAYSMVQVNDGGFALAGYTRSYGVGTPSYRNMYLVKTDASGNMQWNKTYGGTDHDEALSLVQTSDGGYALAGYTRSYGAGSGDFWLLKTDSDGNPQWNQTYGGTYPEVARSLVQISDGGYALGGQTSSASSDMWLVKTDSSGNLQWNQTYGVAEFAEMAQSLVQTTDGGYALAGARTSGLLWHDFWLVKTNASGNELWDRTYGGPNDDFPHSLVQTNDGGYALAGETDKGSSNYDAWLVKTDQAGNLEWNQTYGGPGSDSAYTVIEMDEGDYALAGSTYSVGYDAWLIRTESELGLTVGLTVTDFTNSAITVYRARTDPFWNYVRVRIWLIKEPSWIYGDINMDGVVDAQDLYIISRNYGKTFSLLSLTGIIGIASVHTIKKRKQNNTQHATKQKSNP